MLRKFSLRFTADTTPELYLATFPRFRRFGTESTGWHVVDGPRGGEGGNYFIGYVRIAPDGTETRVTDCAIHLLIEHYAPGRILVEMGVLDPIDEAWARRELWELSEKYPGANILEKIKAWGLHYNEAGPAAEATRDGQPEIPTRPADLARWKAIADIIRPLVDDGITGFASLDAEVQRRYKGGTLSEGQLRKIIRAVAGGKL